MHSLSQPIGYFEGDDSPQMPDLLTSICVEDCLNCNDIYSARDPLGVCPPEYLNAIYHVYMNLRASLFVCDRERTDRNAKLFVESKADMLSGIEKLKSDIGNKENLYELFFDIWSKDNTGAYYSQEEFYEYLEGLFEFAISYWESVVIAIDQVQASNSDEGYRNKVIGLHMLLDDTKFTDSPGNFDGLLKNGEILPYQKSYELGGKKIFLCVDGNISTERMDELKRLKLDNVFKQRAKNKKHAEELRIIDKNAKAYHRIHNRWPDDYEVRF